MSWYQMDASFQSMSDDDLKSLCERRLEEREFGWALKLADALISRNSRHVSIAYFYKGKAFQALGDSPDSCRGLSLDAFDAALAKAEGDVLDSKYCMLIETNIARNLYVLGRYEEADEIYAEWYRGLVGGWYDYNDMSLMLYCLTLRRLGCYEKAERIASNHEEDAENKEMIRTLIEEMKNRTKPEDSVFLR